jgi:hypothetical protein
VRKKILALAALPLVLAFLGGCGSSGHSTPPPSNNVPVVLSISDTAAAAGESLPAGVNLISVQASVTGACLLTSSDSSTAACPVGQSLLPSGASVQFSALTNPSQLDTLSNTAVTANTYVSLALMFGSPISETISVDPGANFTDGTNSCDNTVGTTPLFCQISPVVSTTTATVTFASPITLTAGTPASFIVGLDVTGSTVATGPAPATLSFNPVVTVTQGAPGADGNLIDVNNVSGTVSSIGGGLITLTDNATGLPLTLNTGSATVTNYPMNATTCTTANTLTCIQVGDVVTLSYGASNTNPVQFTAVNIAGNPGITSAGGFQGTIVEAGATPEVVVTAIPAGSIIGLSGVGQVLGLNAATAVFSNSTGAALPVGSFASASDLVVGQNVFVDVCPLVGGVATCSYTPPVVGPPAVIGSVTADAIELLPSNVSGLFTAPAAPNFTVTGLNSFYTGNGVTSLAGSTSASTVYSGTVSAGFSALVPGNTYFYTGYLANSGTLAQPDLITTGIFGNE